MENINKPAFSFSHMGINSENIEEAKNVADFLVNIFGLAQNEDAASIFIEKEIEIIKSIGLGKNGHIAFYTESIEIAIKYLEEKGIKFNYESAKYKEDGKLAIVYLEEEINGFAIHLTSKK
jgi:2-dehydro-3-deoxyphosphogluconate aldolase/(4S)-4-hydroxy-2-oxoglutarate aldolase